jgi:hypothetical protein
VNVELIFSVQLWQVRNEILYEKNNHLDQGIRGRGLKAGRFYHFYSAGDNVHWLYDVGNDLFDQGEILGKTSFLTPRVDLIV